MPQTTINVLTVDPHHLVHSGVRQMLSPYEDIAVVGAAYSRSEALSFCRRAAPDVALVEVTALGRGWQDGLAELMACHAGLRPIILAHALDRVVVVAALRAGAAGYLLKSIEPLALALAVRTAAAGQAAICAEAMQVMLAEQAQGAEPAVALSQREREVLLHLVRGLSNIQIAEQMAISKATTKFHIKNLFGKLGVASRCQAISLAFERQLVPPAATSGGEGRRDEAGGRPWGVGAPRLELERYELYVG